MTLNIEALHGFLATSDHYYFKNGVWYAKTTARVSYPKDAYDVFYPVEDDSYWFRHRNNCIISLVKKYSGKDLFFDIGGGNGVVAKALENAGVNTVLVEPDMGGVTNARQRNVSNVICGTVEDLIPLNARVVAIGAFDVIEHIKDDHAFVAQIREMLRRDGMFYITVPAYKFLWSDEDVFAGHYRRYRLHDIKKLLERNNFEFVYSTYFFSILLPPVFVYRTLMSKLGFYRKNTNISKDHKNQSGIAGRLLDAVWRWEVDRINKLKYIPFGNSCLVIAKKK